MKVIQAGKHPNMIPNRHPSGNMLILMALTMAIIFALVMTGLTFNCFLFQCTHAQCEADAVALRLASEINKGDRVGQLNELEECSRELVYVSRKDLKNGW